MLITDKTTAKELNDYINKSKDDKISLDINHYGGSIHDAIACYNVLKNADKKITINIKGLAAGSGSLIPLGAAEVTIDKDAYVMITSPTMQMIGKTYGVKSILTKTWQAMRNIYLEHTSLSEEKLTQLMDEETFFNAEEAVKYGFANKINHYGR